MSSITKPVRCDLSIQTNAVYVFRWIGIDLPLSFFLLQKLKVKSSEYCYFLLLSLLFILGHDVVPVVVKYNVSFEDLSWVDPFVKVKPPPADRLALCHD